MSEISKRIIDAVKMHVDECGDGELVIAMEGDLETEIDAILLDAVFPVAPNSNE